MTNEVNQGLSLFHGRTGNINYSCFNNSWQFSYQKSSDKMFCLHSRVCNRHSSDFVVAVGRVVGQTSRERWLHSRTIVVVVVCRLVVVVVHEVRVRVATRDAATDRRWELPDDLKKIIYHILSDIFHGLCRYAKIYKCHSTSVRYTLQHFFVNKYRLQTFKTTKKYTTNLSLLTFLATRPKLL